MGMQLLFVFIGMVLAWIFLKLNWSDELTIVLAFLPALLTIIYTNVERIRLFISKIIIINKTVSVTVIIKNTYEINDGIQDETFIEKRLEEALLKSGVTIGRENNRIRIEAGQVVRFAKDNNIMIKVPLVMYLQIVDKNKLTCKLTNSLPTITYREIPTLIRSTQRVWDFIDEHIKDSSKGKLKHAIYNAKIKVDDNVFKNVYLAPYAPRYIKNLELQKENSTIKLADDTLEINSKSKHDFEMDIKKYSSLFKGFFEEKGVR
ncbi:hypothetical protein CLOACE_03000 [Clostridium acetireducens DSM 10703]|uniref:Uncharacterized protein n=1 Tax=Clostridium acetireducens DSM 10703 TaxID=1121290 RepID=A0A1E8F2B7_9CLOT|nr:hypothetical protein [Clostridium acetireducens]OFI07471.1 hypothetical protein CLOACE_03000 [Clostridium acetireducens DSM 10703]